MGCAKNILDINDILCCVTAVIAFLICCQEVFMVCHMTHMAQVDLTKCWLVWAVD